MGKNLDVRQSEFRGILQQLFPYVAGQTLDVLLESIDLSITSPLNVDATHTPSLVINIGPSVVSNTESNRQKSITFINNLIPAFAGGTITFPSTTGGNIVASTGGSVPLNLPIGDYCKVLLALDSSGNLITSVGTPALSPSLATVPSPTTNTFPFAYVILFNNAGTIQNIVQNNIFQLESGGGSAGGGSSSSNSLWIAKQVGLTNNTTSLSVSFPTAQPDISYAIFGIIGNVIDTFPQYQQVEITNKTVNGFVFTWNHPLDSSNYFISYIIPPKILPITEASIGLGVNSLSSTLPISQPASTYGVIAELQNITDPNPQFQAVVIGANSTNNVNLKWNVATDSSNYIAPYMVGATGQVSIPNGVTSVTVSLPINYGAVNYGIVASIQNLTDTNPRYQPMIIISQTNNSVTFGWNTITDTANYLLNYYAISQT